MANVNLPAVELLGLPNDHTAGGRVGSSTRCRFRPCWVVDSDLRGRRRRPERPDHVDAHRTVNSSTAVMAATSAKQDLVEEDRIDETTFNQAIWQSVKGAGSKMPAARHNVIAASAADD